MSARKFLRVELVPTTLTHLVCVGCGRFHCDFAIVSLAPDVDDGEGHAGIHKACIKNVKAKRGVK